MLQWPQKLSRELEVNPISNAPLDCLVAFVGHDKISAGATVVLKTGSELFLQYNLAEQFNIRHRGNGKQSH
jgi:hypothetical protein